MDHQKHFGRGGRGYSRHRIRSSSTRGADNWRSHQNRDEMESNKGQQFEEYSLPRVYQDHSNSPYNHQHRHGFSRDLRIGFKYLESLLEQPLEDVLSKVNGNKSFFDLLEKKNLDPDYIVLMVKLISRFCDCEFSTLRNHVLKKSLNISFVESIQLYMSSLAVQSDIQKKRNSHFWKDPDSFWFNLLKACKTALRLMPQYYSEVLSTILKLTLLNIPQIESMHKIHTSDSIKSEFKDLIDIVEAIPEEFEGKGSEALAGNTYEDEPPDDFHEISVYPTTQELIGNRKPFLRKNIVKGPFKDVEQYLDIQFRLLREDFVGPLREGLQAYLSKTPTRIQNVRIHKRVQFLHPVTATEHYCVLLKFNFTNRQTTFNYEDSRRFIFGSLVCFTRDNFKSLIFGKIVDRNDEYLSKGLLVIGFDVNQELLFNTDYIMVECSVYFEPYYHVLTVMKSLRQEDFPLMNYIIDVDTKAAMPDYITPDEIYEIKGPDLKIVDLQPFRAINEELKGEFYNFNPSQNEAFIAALTRKLSIIQGPPGTGKTFVGLKIAQTLLNNQQAWYSKTPMLIICYTNHALDQFLEGLLNITDEIVRIGGQSKNKNLEKFNLRNYSGRMNNSLFHTKINVRCCLSEIKFITDTLAMISDYDCIFDFKVFREIIPQFKKSWLASAKKKDVLNWLLEMGNKYNSKYNGASFQFKDLPIRESVNAERVKDDEEYDEHVDEPFEDLMLSLELKHNIPFLSLSQLHGQIKENNHTLTNMEAQLGTENYDVIFAYTNLQMETDGLHRIYEYAKKKLDLAKRGAITTPSNVNIMESQFIPRDERWNLYFYWLNIYNEFLLRRHEKMNEEFRLQYKLYNESRDLENVKILRDMKVIGMTTTGAARLHSSLQMIKSPIVIVEEAAEVLEAHIVTSLTKDCQQLILIGDHQQLKPSTSNYRIETFYNLGISLFERMILNNIQCFSLNVQHRMRPEISALIKPAIYPKLEDHDSVFNRPDIKGMDKCLYFIDHKYPEEIKATGTTKKNIHEAKFLIQLAIYLILNGYKAGEITILAAYLGQMFELQKERSNYAKIRDIKITVLDNYQGEESDIILLSLVRNNSENKIGFLSIDNRVCVALSRARNGLYIMGNIKQLSANSALWVDIEKSLMKQAAIGPSISLKCQNHNKITLISTTDDFSSVVEGGCNQICGMLLRCQHNCQRLCHAYDGEHVLYKCQEPCNKNLCSNNASHICQKKCYEECGPCTYLCNILLKCNHEASVPCHIDVDVHNCLTEVRVTLQCGHETEKPCYRDLEEQRCPFPCDTRLECGHSCIRTCHILDDPDHLNYKCVKPCGNPCIGCNNPELEDHMCPKLCWDDCARCDKIVRRARTKCPHQFDIECHRNVDDIECLKPCKKLLSCGHKCKNVCSAACGPCTEKIKKVIPGCNHTTSLLCYMEPVKSHCSETCPRIMSCGHVCKRRCNEVCDPLKCQEMVSVSIPAKCGHTVERVPCSVSTLYKTEDAVEGLESYCTFPCNEVLKCGLRNQHICSGTCGTCFQGRIHMRCADKCGRILVCNHECEISCRETCKPCQKPCSYKCRHSACKKTCGEPCSRCREDCPRTCEHQKCRYRCGDICSIPPCMMPCEKRLKKCGHPCVGFCGDPCPPLCRICDKEILEEIFMGTEDDENARFVLLTDCGHVLESSGMEQWLDQDENEIKLKFCPKCKTTIYTTERYSDYIKLAVLDILKVKLKHCGTNDENSKKRKKLETEITDLKNIVQFDECFTRNHQKILIDYFNVLQSRLNEKNKSGRAQSVNSIELNAIEIKCQLLGDVVSILKRTSRTIDIEVRFSFVEKVELQVKFILANLLRNTDDITNTEIEDFRREIKRLRRMVQLSLISGIPRCKIMTETKPETENIIDEVSALINSISKYEYNMDTIVTEHLTNLKEMFKSFIKVAEAEKRIIVRAIGLSQGHWFKCPNGHPYAIGECGGAMQIGRCNECNEPIGGTSHALLPSNAIATEMDGATYGAWSKAANMANYDLQDLI